MGLDNGFYVKSNKRKITRDILPNGIVYPFDKDYMDEVEIVYHRKDWGWRNEIMNTFGWRDNMEKCSFEIEKPSDVMTLINITASWMNEKRWEDEGSSIWDYNEIHDYLVRDIVNFALIMAFMENNPDIYLEFYDSY